MLAEDRLNAIVSMVQRAGSVTVPELAEALGVTASTIRRDLQTLDRAHRIAKVHGGATSLERAHVTRDLTISERSDLHNDDKERICARAAALVEPESFVYIDSGSTTLRLIEHLPHLESVTYVTDSVLHAQHLAVRGMRTVVLGGEVAELLGDALLDALVGPDALATLDRYNFNCGFWGSNGIAAEQGFTTPDIEEAQVKRISMRHTAKRFVISDASKFGMVAPVKFADFRDATIITAGEVPAKYQSMDNVITV